MLLYHIVQSGASYSASVEEVNEDLRTVHVRRWCARPGACGSRLVGPERLMLWCARRNGPVFAPTVPAFWGVTSTNYRFCPSWSTAFGTFVFFSACITKPQRAPHTNMAPAGERHVGVSPSDWPRRHCCALHRSRPLLCCLCGPCMARRSAPPVVGCR
jgi:hypothetical protein